MIFLSALTLTLRLFLVGLAVGWPLIDRIASEGSYLRKSFLCGSVALLIGLSVNLVTVLLLGEAELYHRHGLESSLLGLLVVSGLSWSCLRGRTSMKNLFLHGSPTAAVFLLGVVVILALPNRCEWIVGGWDPGVYVNEGVALEKEGTFHPSDTLFSTSLSEEEKALFTRTGFGRTERFPGVVVDDERDSFTFEFFRLMPSMVAMLHRTGGLEMTVMTNMILGLLSALFFAAMVLQFTGASHSLPAALLFMAQPLWLYHTHVPVSEMLHLSLLLGVGVVLPWRARSLWAPAILGLLFFSLMLNRYSFLPLAGLALAALAMADSVRADRRRVFAEHLIMAAAIAAAAALDLYIAPVTPGTWDPRPPLEKVFLLFAGTVLFIDVLGGKAFFRKAAAPPRIIRYSAALAGAGAAVALFLVRNAPDGPHGEQADNIFRLVSYVSPPVAAAALAGCLLFFLPRKNHDPLSKWFMAFLLGVSAIFLYDKHIVDIYPWATRRYLPYAIPAFSFLAAYPAASLWNLKRHRRPARALALALLFILLAGTARKSWHAWSRVQLAGVAGVIAQTADQIKDNDIVIVDSPRWGTPLALIHGKEVLNGKHLWRRKSVTGMKEGLAVLARLHREGYRIRFLTSTESAGLDIYPVGVEPVTLDWESGDFSLEEMIHSRRAADFVVSEGTYHLRLYTWTPPPFPGMNDHPGLTGPGRSFVLPLLLEYHGSPSKGARQEDRKRNTPMKNLISRLRKIRHGNPVVIVSGLPRSGTSMAMQMLLAGGIEAATDSVREGDEDNPRGYFELEKVKHLAEEGDKSWLKEYRGQAVKVISFLLRELPRSLNYRVVFVTRDLSEILLSQKKMLTRRRADDGVSDHRLQMNFTSHLRQVRFFLDRAPNFETLYLEHRDIVDRPAVAAARMNAFLGGKLDEAAMAAAVDRTLYRNRREGGAE